MTLQKLEGTVRLTRQMEINPHTCGGCGVVFGLEAEYEAERRKDKKTWYCPNGCQRAYVESEADRLRKQLDSQRESTNYYIDRLHAEERSHSSTKGQLTKVKNRIHAGVCPHCTRTFVNLARHMTSKHSPESASERGEGS